MSDDDARNEESKLARLEARGTLRTVTVRLTATATLRIARQADVYEIDPVNILSRGDYDIEEVG